MTASTDTPSPAGDEASSDLDALFRAVGFVVIQWGIAEQTLDFVVAEIFHKHNGSVLNGKRQRLPRMLKPKLEYLRRCVNSTSELQPFRDQAYALVERFESLSRTRHDLVHGAIVDLRMRDDAFIIAKLDVCEDWHHAREVKFASRDFPRLTKDLIDLGAAATAFLRRLVDCDEAQR